MKQIKTIYKELNPRFSNDPQIQEFDDELNKALEEGWKLIRREVLPPHTGRDRDIHRTLYAELERETVEAKKSTQVTRCCENCKYYHIALQQEPCRSCENVNNIPDKWEAEPDA